MEYTIVSSPDLANFVTQVNEHLQDGWELHGESAYTVAGYSQAMTTTKTKGKAKTAKEPAEAVDDASSTPRVGQGHSPKGEGSAKVGIK